MYSSKLKRQKHKRIKKSRFLMEAMSTKWVAAVASIWIQCISGSTYTYSIFSSALRSTQSYDQSTLDTVLLFKDIGSNSGVLAGLLYTATVAPNAIPWVMFLVGAVECFVGYFLMWVSVAGVISRPPVPVMCLFVFMAAQSLTFFDTANVVTTVRNFGDHGGAAVGIMKGFVGISGAILIRLYQTVCKDDPTSYILLLAFTSAILAIALMPFVRTFNTSTTDDSSYLNGIYVICMIIAAYLFVITILDNLFGLSPWVQRCTFAFLLVLLASPLIIARNARRDHTKKLGQDPLLNKAYSIEDQAEAGFDDNTPEKGENMNLLQAMSSLNFWLLFVTVICGTGTATAMLNNVRQIGESLRYSNVEIDSLVSLWSIWSYIGRLGAGYASDMLLHKKGWSRPLLMVTTLATMTLGHLVIASGFRGNLYVGSVTISLAYGSQWSLMPTIAYDLFGVRHMGTIVNFISVASPIGSYIFSVRIIGYIYDKASNQDGTCYGTRCFMSSFIIMAAVGLLGVFVSCGLVSRTKTFYRQLAAKRLSDPRLL